MIIKEESAFPILKNITSIYFGDLKKYGIEGITFKITDNIPTYQTLKDKYISNTFKILSAYSLFKSSSNL